MFGPLMVFALLGVGVALFAAVAVGYRELKKGVADRLDQDAAMAFVLRGALDQKSGEPYWSCQSTTRARETADQLIRQADESIAAARGLGSGEFAERDRLERRVRAKLDAALYTLLLAENELVPLIDRMRQAVEATQVQTLETQALVADLLRGLEARGVSLPEESARLAALRQALKASREEIPRAPVTTLRALNAQSAAVNAVLKEIAGLVIRPGGVK